jgi:hypothetical protein
MSDDNFCKINTSELIKSARSVSQYKIKNKNGIDRLVTVIGELHEMEFDCNGTSISIYEYCLSRSTNNKCYFMFEYHPDSVDNSRIGSNIIRDVFTSGKNNVKKHSIGIDTRIDFLTRNAQTRLYNDEYGFEKEYGDNQIKIRNDYIQPFDKNKLLHANSTELKSYVNKLNKKFTDCDEHLNNHSTIYELKWAWAMVMDYTILEKMLRPDDDINEYVIVVGENHCKNIHDTVLTWSKDVVEILSNETRQPDTCITTKTLKKQC